MPSPNTAENARRPQGESYSVPGRIIPRASSNRKTIVVGAGISGLSTAIYLGRAGVETEIWESSRELGGLLAPVSFQGQQVDKGAHRFHPEAHHAMFELLKDIKWQRLKRDGRLIMRESAIPYPLSPFDFLRALGWRASSGMIRDFLTHSGRLRLFTNWNRERFGFQKRTMEPSFEEFVSLRVGNEAYRSFYKPYAEKVWGLSGKELSCSLAKKRLSTTKPVRLLWNNLQRKAEKTQVFLYPEGGMSRVIETLVKEVHQLGISIRLGRSATLERLRRERARHIFFSGNIGTLLGRNLAGEKSSSQIILSHRGLYLLYLSFPSAVVAGHDTFYVPERKYWFGRVSRADRFNRRYTKEKTCTLCVEIPEGRWGKKQNFIDGTTAVVDQLVQAGILSSPVTPLKFRQMFLPAVYPLYRRGWYSRWTKQLDALLAADNRILPIGRNGLFLHCNIDHCVAISKDAVNHALSGLDAGTWQKQTHRYHNLIVRD